MRSDSFKACRWRHWVSSLKNAAAPCALSPPLYVVLKLTKQERVGYYSHEKCGSINSLDEKGPNSFDNFSTVS